MPAVAEEKAARRQQQEEELEDGSGNDLEATTDITFKQRLIGYSERMKKPRWWYDVLCSMVPAFRWLPKYSILNDLPFDFVAGLTVGCTLVPQCLSYAAICNVRSEFGLYTSFFGQFVYFLLGTSKDGSFGPTSIIGMIMGMVNAMYNPLVDEGDNTYNAVIIFISGLVLILIGILKLGFIVSLFSVPVVSGFTSAAGFVIIGSQMKLFFGLKWGPNDSPGAFVKQMKNIYDRREEIKDFDVVCGIVVMATLLLFQYSPKMFNFAREIIAKIRKQPLQPLGPRGQKAMRLYALIVGSRNAVVFILSTGVAYYFYCQDPENFEKKLTLVGRVRPGLPSFLMPSWEIWANRTVQLNPAEIAALPANSSVIANASGTFMRKYVRLKSANEIVADLSAYIIIVPLMVMLESFAILKALGRKNGYTTSPSNELWALGLANFLQSFVNGFPCTTSISRCALNDQCGVRTQMASVVSATIIIITLVVLTPLFYFIPKPTLAGIMLVTGWNLLDWTIVYNMWKESRMEVFICLASFILCLLYDIAYGILILILINMVIVLRPIINVPLHTHHRPMVMESGAYSDEHFVTVVKLPHGMEYPSCDSFIEGMCAIIGNSKDKNIVVNCEFIYRIDYSGIQAFRNIILTAFKAKKHLIFTHLNEEFANKFREIGMDHFEYAGTVDDAVNQRHWRGRGSIASGMGHRVATIVAPPGSSLAEAVQRQASHAGEIKSSVSKADLLPLERRKSKPYSSDSDSDSSDVMAAGVEGDLELEGKPPVTSEDAGASQQQVDSNFGDTSLVGVFADTTVRGMDDETMKEWQRTANDRLFASMASISKLAHKTSRPKTKPPQLVGSDEAPVTAEEAEYLRTMLVDRRHKVADQETTGASATITIDAEISSAKTK